MLGIRAHKGSAREQTNMVFFLPMKSEAAAHPIRPLAFATFWGDGVW
jgi:hypothetical protein